jgi:hypothetical protein
MVQEDEIFVLPLSVGLYLGLQTQKLLEIEQNFDLGSFWL